MGPHVYSSRPLSARTGHSCGRGMCSKATIREGLLGNREKAGLQIDLGRCYALAAMRIALGILSGILLFLSLLAGPTGAAAAPGSDANTEIAFHGESDADEVPGCPLTGTAHHHACAGHFVAAADLSNSDVGISVDGLSFVARSDLFPAGHAPPAQLRPPIA